MSGLAVAWRVTRAMLFLLAFCESGGAAHAQCTITSDGTAAIITWQGRALANAQVCRGKSCDDVAVVNGVSTAPVLPGSGPLIYAHAQVAGGGREVCGARVIEPPAGPFERGISIGVTPLLGLVTGFLSAIAVGAWQSRQQRQRQITNWAESYRDTLHKFERDSSEDIYPPTIRDIDLHGLRVINRVRSALEPILHQVDPPSSLAPAGRRALVQKINLEILTQLSKQ